MAKTYIEYLSPGWMQMTCYAVLVHRKFGLIKLIMSDITKGHALTFSLRQVEQPIIFFVNSVSVCQASLIIDKHVRWP